MRVCLPYAERRRIGWDDDPDGGPADGGGIRDVQIGERPRIRVGVEDQLGAVKPAVEIPVRPGHPMLGCRWAAEAGQCVHLDAEIGPEPADRDHRVREAVVVAGDEVLVLEPHALDPLIARIEAAGTSSPA